MRALVYTGPYHLELKEVPLPSMAPGEVLVRVEASAVCGSDLHGFVGKSKKRIPPLIMGHEVSGRVVAVGDKGLKSMEGRLVAVYPLVTCGSCTACKTGRENICAKRELIGIDRPGGFADFLVVPQSCLSFLPPSMDAVLGCLVEPLANAVHIVRRHTREGVSSIAIFGAGPQGIFVCALANRIGIPTIIVSDVNGDRLEAARRLGATHVLKADESDPVGKVWSATGGEGAGLAIDAVGLAETRRQACACVAGGGSVVLLGLAESSTEFDCVEIISREISLHGTYAYRKADFQEAATLLAEGEIDIREWIVETTLEHGHQAFLAFLGKPKAVKVVFRFDESQRSGDDGGSLHG